MMPRLLARILIAVGVGTTSLMLPTGSYAQFEHPNLQLPKLATLAGCGGALCKAAGKVVTGAKKVAGGAQKAAEGAAKGVAKVVGGVPKAVGGAAAGVAKAAVAVPGDVVTVVQKAGGDTITTVQKAGGDVVKIVQHVGGATEQTLSKAGSNTVTTIQKAGDDTVTTVQKSANDVTVTVVKANSDITTNVDKGWKDTTAQGQRSFQDGVGAVTAVATFEKNEVKGVVGNFDDAAKRLKEGKVVDALWGLGTEPLQNTDKDAAAAAEESAVLNTLATVAAGAYGGPGGAAAYAAWLTYNETGNAELALRAGMITGATSLAFSQVNAMPTGDAGAIARKAIVGAAVGGLAVAAAGGDKEAIQNGFLLSGGMILVQTAYQAATDHEIDARASNHEAYCMATVGANCSAPDVAYMRDADGNIQYEKDADGVIDHDKPLVDVTKTDPRYNHVGIWSTENDHSLIGERGAFMTAVSKVPGMNAMALFHDEWTVSWGMGTTATVSTIVPATVLTYVGTGAPVYERIQTAFTDPSKAPATPPVPGSYSCKSHEFTRTISVIANNTTPGCHVIYRTETGLSTPWNARNDTSYCAAQTGVLAHNLGSAGWSCSPG